MKILVYDRCACTRELYRREFEEEGFDVLTACSLRDALKYFRSEAPALILFSTDNPGAGLLGTIEQIRSSNARMPIVFAGSFMDSTDDSNESASWYMERQPGLVALKQAIKDLAHHAAERGSPGGNFMPSRR